MKICVVTGALQPGIGQAITSRLLSEGYSVIGTYEAEHEVNMPKEYVKNLSLIKVDHSSRKSLCDFVKKIKDNKIHALVNVAMFFAMENPDSFDHDIWDKSLAINLTAPNFLIHSLKKSLNIGASIVTVTSTEAFIGSFGASAYAATKAAIHNLMKTHANNLGNKNIRVNVVAPGWIGGVMDTDEVFNMSRRITPLGRLGKAEEVAASVNFLLSDEASFVNGTTLTVDGGYTSVDTISKYEFDASKSS
jgi:NAD(P)-dependent dehydrogenase (short-subunit alcohol dehydrogenase family)